MASITWYYAHGSDRRGPLSLEEMQSLAARGEVGRDDLVWRDGMSEWAAAGSLPELFPAAAEQTQRQKGTPVAPIFAPPAQPAAAVASVGYYVPGGNMPPRAARNLLAHATPTGDTGDWPLDDSRVAVFRDTMKLRKRITSAAQLYRLLFAIVIIVAVIFVLAFLAAGAVGRRGATPALLAGVIPMAIIAVAGVLYFFAWRYTMRSQRWAPLTMFILFIIAVAINLISIVVAVGNTNGPDAAAGMIAGLIGMVFPLVFAVVSWQAFAAIPKYLNQPAWCQELIAASGL